MHELASCLIDAGIASLIARPPVHCQDARRKGVVLYAVGPGAHDVLEPDFDMLGGVVASLFEARGAGPRK